MTAAVPIIRTSRLSVLTTEQVMANWGVIAGFLAQGARYSLGRMGPDDIKKALEDELGLVVIAWNPDKGEVYAAFFCEVDRYPTGVVCFNIALAGGREIDEWIHLWPSLTDIARQHGADQIEITGRPGWGKVLGLREKARLFVEEL